MSHARKEVLAGFVAAIVAVPQCVALGVAAFGLLAKDYPALAQVAGFYSAIIAGLFVSLGAKGQISLTGPRIGSATVLSGTVLALLATGNGAFSASAVLGMVLLVMMAAGLLQWGLGYAQLASLQSYIARPVLVGLMTGVALTMFLAQCRLLLAEGLVSMGISLLTFAVAATIFWLGKYPRLTFLQRHGWLLSWGMVMASAVGIGLYFLLPESLGDKGATLAPIHRLWVLPDVLGALKSAGAAIAGTPDLLWSLAPATLMLAVVGSLDTTTSHVATRQKLRKRPMSPWQRATVSQDNENRELTWHGLGNAVAPLFGGITSSASDARAEAALAAEGRTWVGGLAYTGVLAMLLAITPWLQWTMAFPKAVIVGLMMHIAMLLLVPQIKDLQRYGRAARHTLENLARPGPGTGMSRENPLETVMNGATVVLVGYSLYEFDPLRALALGMLCSMLIFLVKIGQAQRHRCYPASVRGSLEPRSRDGAARAAQARSQCQIIKLHGDFFFLSHKKAMGLIEEVKSRCVPDAQQRYVGQYVIIDFDMAHEFDESGIHEIKLMIERLQEKGFTVLLSYVSLKLGLMQLLHQDQVIGGAGAGKTGSLIPLSHVFESTERAINYVEDLAVQSAGAGALDQLPWPEALASLAALPASRFDQATGDERFWVVRRGRVVLRQRVSQSVSERRWSKVIAELGVGGVVSSKALAMPGVSVEPDPEGEVVAVDQRWIEEAIDHRPGDAARVMAYFADQVALLQSMLQTEAVMLDY